MKGLRNPPTGSAAALGGLLALSALAVLTPERIQARPEYAKAEGKSCAYCHEDPKGGKRRNYRGRYYGQKMRSFAGFNNADEAKKAGVVPLPEEGATLAAFKATTDPKLLPDFAEWVGPAGITFIKIPAGAFLRGTTDAQKAELQKAGVWTAMDAVEQPSREVRLTRPFLLSKTEVTQAQWKALMNGANPSAFKGDTLPVENISWPETQAFCKALRDAEPNAFYRLPTEAEWEYVARAGSTDLYAMGADKTPITPATLKEYTWMNGTANNKTQPVGTKKPNAWGLHDMQGNVWEWCQDWYSPTSYASLPPADPLYKSTAATERVLRGGCWYLDSRAQRVALRGGNLPTYKSQYAGFRVVREL